MTYKRKITSLVMLCSFIALAASGLLSFFTEYTRAIASVHTVSGILFTAMALVHLMNNLRPLMNYSRSKSFLYSLLGVGAIAYFSFAEVNAVQLLMDYGARSKAKSGVSLEDHLYDKIVMGAGRTNQLTLDIKKAKHFWHPQIAIWTEDTLGNYKETLYVTKATAKGIFAGGRSKENYKSLDMKTSQEQDSYRRVNALPVWSHKRGVVYKDGLYVPTSDHPLPDAISGATPLGNFIFESSVDYEKPFVVYFEINVAFDDNEYYSEYDFPEDKTFHNGTGQLGQPSLIYSGRIDPRANNGKQMMELQGHGHHSAQDGLIYGDLSKVTTALELIEFAVLGFKNNKD